MSLIDQLRDVETFTPSAEPVAAELAGIVGRLIAYVEHGEEFLRAVEDDVKSREAGEPANRVNELLSPPPADEPPAAVPAPAAPAAAAPAAPAVDERDEEIVSLRQQLATAQAQLERTQVEPTPEPPPGDVPPHPTRPGVE